MTVSDLIRELEALPGHWPVHVAVRADGSGGGADTDFLFTLDVQRDNFPSQGTMAVIRVDQDGDFSAELRAQEEARLRNKRRHPDTKKGA